MITPSWLKEKERSLKYQSEALFFEGISLQKILLEKTESTRESNAEIQVCIDDGWKKVLEENNEGKRKAYGAERGRYEGITLDSGFYKVGWSLTDYGVHAALKDNPKYFDPNKQARPLTINSIIETKDHMIPIGLKRGPNTDQGAINSLTAIGFMDIVEDGGTKILESVGHAVSRRVLSEWKLPVEAVTSYKMKPLILVDNAVQNFDLAFGVYVPLAFDSSEMDSNELHEKGKFKEIQYVSTSEKSLLNKIYDFASKPKTSSGHMVGDLVALTADKYGGNTEDTKSSKYDKIVTYIRDSL